MYKNGVCVAVLLRPVMAGAAVPYPEPKPSKESSPGESHPQALAQPDVNLSAHPAPIIQRPRKDSP